ncbi:hypothetical protein V2H45_05910 [Tumidithrix elongata RA019]|uniref:Uncharacterized protein n=1 Tax=Tumidithrix elongata BACA0141 TaxID=2716417 RepID=A0AAW9PUS0_9CYAN|nr:hypothetical protein [Tumidithrix elongata RA019]
MIRPIQTITKLAESTFRCSWVGVENSTLKLNFDVLIDHFQLEGKFCLVHWQAKPRNFRKWGVYCHSADAYFSVKFDKLIFEEGMTVKALQIPDKVTHTIPTAVLIYLNTYVQENDGLIWIKKAGEGNL